MAGLNPTDMTAIDMKKADAVSRTEPLTPPLLLELKWQAWNFSTYIIEAVLSVLGPAHLPPYRVSP